MRSVHSVLTAGHWPDLAAPVMLIALSGWVDAGLAGGGAVAALREQLRDADEFATIDLTDVMDLQQTRPIARWESDGVRVIDWPEITLVAGGLGRDVVVVSGPEPSLRWLEVTAAIVDAARTLGVTEAYTLAGMPGMGSAAPRAAHADHPVAVHDDDFTVEF